MSYDKYYKLMNPFHLTKPWRTSGLTGEGSDSKEHFGGGGEVLLGEARSEQLLEDWHKDLKTPKYKCFTDSGSVTAPKEGSRILR